MLLAIDIGNTGINLGIFDDDRLKITWQLATEIHRMADEYGIFLLNLLQHQKLPPSKISGVSLCSVVPPLVPTFQEMCQKHLNTPPLVVEAGVKTGMKIHMDNPREVGPDRVVNAVAAHRLYRNPVIIIDFGTATTFDVISQEGDYLGGAIAPGISIASEALFKACRRYDPANRAGIGEENNSGSHRRSRLSYSQRDTSDRCNKSRFNINWIAPYL